MRRSGNNTGATVDGLSYEHVHSIARLGCGRERTEQYGLGAAGATANPQSPASESRYFQTAECGPRGPPGTTTARARHTAGEQPKDLRCEQPKSTTHLRPVRRHGCAHEHERCCARRRRQSLDALSLVQEGAVSCETYFRRLAAVGRREVVCRESRTGLVITDTCIRRADGRPGRSALARSSLTG